MFFITTAPNTYQDLITVYIWYRVSDKVCINVARSYNSKKVDDHEFMKEEILKNDNLN